MTSVGGLAVARALRKAPVRITLIDWSNHNLFQPLLYQVVTATLAPGDIASPIRHLLRKQRNVTVTMAEVTGVDVANRRVLVNYLGKPAKNHNLGKSLNTRQVGKDGFSWPVNRPSVARGIKYRRVQRARQ